MTIDQAMAQMEALETQFGALKEQVQKMEAQLSLLRAALQGPEAGASGNSFGDLHGVFAGQMDLTEEEIDRALYRFDWEDEAPAGAGA